MVVYGHYIGGQWLENPGDAWIDVENPATGDIIGRVAEGTEADVNTAVAAAKRAFPGWRDTPAEERAALLERVADAMEQRLEDLAQTVTAELGAPVSIAKSWHCEPAAGEARYFAQMAREYRYEHTVPGAKILREPIGVIGCITPWNFPVDQITIKVFPALAAGNCVVLKPSQYTPLTAHLIAEAIHEAHFPAGVFNIVNGRGSVIGNVLASHPDIRMISFTGSTEAGRQVARLALGTIKKVTLELGGKSAAILLPDGDAALAVDTVLDDCFLNSGQTCSALTRLLVPENRLAEAEALIREKGPRYKMGDPLAADTLVGPLIHKRAYQKVREYIALGEAEGAEVIFKESSPCPDRGYFVQPVVFSKVKNDMRIAQEEIFGPVLCVIPYSTVEEAVRLANDSPYGLCGGVFGSPAQALAVARQMETGGVRINGGGLTLGAPFGGYKQSGLGREYSVHEFEDYLEIKSLLLGDLGEEETS